jgi:WASH complex subunit strumpellin
MLYVLLYFSVRTLVEEGSTMREIVDRHFNDNWIITLYMGHVVDLSLE